jgi:hypothetical protein
LDFLQQKLTGPIKSKICKFSFLETLSTFLFKGKFWTGTQFIQSKEFFISRWSLNLMILSSRNLFFRKNLEEIMKIVLIFC